MPVVLRGMVYVWAPDAPTLQSVKEVHVLRYTITLPAKPPISDLANREVTLKLDEVPSVQLLGPDEPSFQFDTDDGVAVEIVLVDIDTSGNRSEPSAPLVFTAEDTIPPPVPGQMAVGNVEQV